MTKPKTREKRIAAQRAKIARLNTRIGALMSQRVLEEEELASLLRPTLDPTKPKWSGNPIVEHGQPFKGDQAIVVEKRTPEGKLDFSAPQPPRNPSMTFDELYDLFFQEDTTSYGNWNALRAWLESKGWVVRAKTW